MYVCMYVEYKYIFSFVHLSWLPRWCRGEESSRQCRRPKRLRFNPWVRKIPCSRKFQPTPVFLPVKFQGQRRLACYSPRGGKESGMINWLSDQITSIQMTCICLFHIWLSTVFGWSFKSKWRLANKLLSSLSKLVICGICVFWKVFLMGGLLVDYW